MNFIPIKALWLWWNSWCVASSVALTTVRSASSFVTWAFREPWNKPLGIDRLHFKRQWQTFVASTLSFFVLSWSIVFSASLNLRWNSSSAHLSFLSKVSRLSFSSANVSARRALSRNKPLIRLSTIFSTGRWEPGLPVSPGRIAGYWSLACMTRL